MEITEFTQKSLIAGTFILQQKLQEDLLRRLRQQNFSYLGALILIALYFERKETPVGPSRLASALKFSRARVSQELSKLERAELIKRHLSTQDFRSLGIKLTAKGDKAALSLVKIFESVQQKVDSVLGERRAEQLNAELISVSKIFKH